MEHNFVGVNQMKNYSDNELTGMEIAVIGMSGKFPGAKNIKEYWDNLSEGKESISFFSADEVLKAGVNEALVVNPNYIKARGILGDVDRFDASFFGYSPKEAALMDPQHRIFLETAWRGLEDAGYCAKQYPGKIGVYASVGFNTYLVLNMEVTPDFMHAEHGPQAMLGNDKDFLASRVSYKLQLTGPSVVVQSACSSSLVAIHQACQSLLSGEADMQLAGGITIRVPEQAGSLYQEGMINSPDGHCRAFDKDAAGTVAGNGVGIVVLKRLEDAVADRDNIYAVIKASAINNDGDDKVGYAAPSTSGQANVIEAAQALAEVPIESIAYVEAHGSGTKMGDPIEIEALRTAFNKQTDSKNFCAVGSVKANIGHLDAAAGVAGFIKSVLALQHKKIPPSVNFTEENPLCEFENSPFYVTTKCLDWPSNGHLRRVGVSSFGMGGTNAHIVLEEAPKRADSGTSRPWQILSVSAKTAGTFDRMKDQLRQDLKQNNEQNLADICYSLHMGRKQFNHSAFVLAQDTEDALNAISQGHNEGHFNAIWDGSERLITFMFSGQGSQYINMARAIYQSEERFKADVDECAEILRSHLGLNLTELIFSDDDNLEKSNNKLNETAYTQPALFTIEYALAKLLMHWGMQPNAMIGHSIGEYVAATLAGVFSLEDALYIVANRGKLIQSLPEGDMLFIPLTESKIEKYLSDNISLAVINSPEAMVLSGDSKTISALQSELESDGVRSKIIRTSHAFHSHMMEPILDEFKTLFTKVKLSAPNIPVISNVTGDWLSAEQACNPDYWAEHIRSTVQFAKGIDKLTKGPLRYFLEVGPGNSLAQFTKQTLGLRSNFMVESCQPKANEDIDALFAILRATGKLWQQGALIDWSAFYDQQLRNRVSLSGYPFMGESYWVDLDSKNKPLSGELSRDEVFWTPSWKQASGVGGKKITPAQALFYGEGGVDQVMDRLSQNYDFNLICREGIEFKASDYQYTVRANNDDDLSQLFAHSKLSHDKSLDVFYSLKKYSGQENIISMLSFLRALGDFASQSSTEIRCHVLASDVFNVVGGEPSHWQSQLVCEYLKSMSYLLPNFAWRFIDSSGSKQKTKVLLLQDLSRFVDEQILAYRNGLRWQLALVPFSLPELEQPEQLNFQVDTYLILGKPTTLIGHLVKTLSESSNAKFVFVSDKIVDNKEWQSELNNGRLEYQCLIDLKEQSVDVEVNPCQVTNVKALRETILSYLNQSSVAVLNFVDSELLDQDNELLNVSQDALHAICKQKIDRQKLLSKLSAGNKHLMSTWFSNQSSLFAHPDRALELAQDLCVRAQAKICGQQTIYLNDDFFGNELSKDWLQRVDFKERVKQLVKIIKLPSQGDFVWLSASSPESYHWLPSKMTQYGVVETNEASANNNLYKRPDLSAPYAAPITERQKIITAIWQDMFQIDKVGIHDDFFDLGGDSVMALKLLSALEIAFNVALPLSEVINSPTAAEQANAIIEFTDVPMDQRRASPAISLQGKGSKPPFFCVHPAGGIIHCYIEMSRFMGKDQPFYAFQHPGIDAKSGPYVTYPKMAEFYVEAMLEIQPEGPYFIGGWSFGGTVAFEMAQQLLALGKEVGMLVLFDSPGPSSLYKLKERPEFEFAGMLAFLSQALGTMFGADIQVPVDEMRKISPENQLDYILERAVEVSGDSELGTAKESLERIVDIFEVCDKGERYYEPVSYPGNIYMYRVQDLADYEFTGYKDHPQLESATFGWDELCDGEVIVRFVPGTHISMIFPPNVHVLTEKFQTDLNERINLMDTEHKEDLICSDENV